MKQYVYFFTRQDISKEQQLVQTAHVAFTHSLNFKDNIVDPNQVHFVVIGVRDLEALNAITEILDRFGFLYSYFCESDLNNELTSIAIMPIFEDDLDISIFKAFNLLKF